MIKIQSFTVVKLSLNQAGKVMIKSIFAPKFKIAHALDYIYCTDSTY